MKYPITATADGYALRLPRIATLSLSSVWRLVARHWGLLAALIIAFGLHAPTLAYYFDGDDFVVLGNAEYLGGRAYIIDTFLMRDIVPNWRPLTGVYYAVQWEVTGLNPWVWRSVNLALHMGSMALLYGLMLRVTRKPATGAIAALIFGVSGAHFDTVTYITAFPHVAATFLTLASLLTIVAYAQGAERRPLLYGASFMLFVLAFLTNEGSFVYAPVIVLAYVLFSRRWRHAPWRAVAHGAPFAFVAAGWLAFYQTCACEQVKWDDFYWGSHVVRNYTVYFSWIVFPAQTIPLSPDALRSGIAVVVALGLIAAFVAGPNVARVAAAGVVLALLPFAPVAIWTASRYTYGAVAFFAPIAAIVAYAAYDRVRRSHDLLRVPATLLGVAFIATVAGLYSWQTHAQHVRSGEGTERWRLLAQEMERNYPDVPPGTTVWIVDGPWTNPMEQYTWVPSVARAIYGDAAAFNLTRDAFQHQEVDLDRALFLEWRDGELRPVEPRQVFTTDR